MKAKASSDNRTSAKTIDEMANDGRLGALAKWLAIQAGVDWPSLDGEAQDAWHERAIEHLRAGGVVGGSDNQTNTEQAFEGHGWTFEDAIADALHKLDGLDYQGPATIVAHVVELKQDPTIWHQVWKKPWHLVTVRAACTR